MKEAIAALYLAAVVATLALAGSRVMPLFEGFQPPQPYQWVRPPPPYAPGNVEPVAAQQAAAIVDGDSAPLTVTTADGQCTVSLPAGSVQPNAGDDRVQAHVEPLDPSSLGAVPAGLHADGNAYRVSLTTLPSGRPIPLLAAPAEVVLAAPVPVHTLLYSADGHGWTPAPTQPVGNPSVAGALFSRSGIFLASSTTDPASLAIRRTGGAGTWAVTLAVAGLAAALVLVPSGIRRLAGRR